LILKFQCYEVLKGDFSQNPSLVWNKPFHLQLLVGGVFVSQKFHRLSIPFSVPTQGETYSPNSK
jgi:hypothetical protein